jgi:F0F1-type ATP synthase membrane subunit b/b'
VIFGRFIPFFIALFPIAAFASEGGGSQVSGLFWRIFVFAIFAVILYKLLSKRVKSALADNAESIRKSLSDAEDACAAAERELRDYAAKIDAMTGELEEMKVVARKTAEKEAENILAEAEKLAVKHRERVKAAVEAEIIKAVSSLRSETALKAIEQAERTLAARKDGAQSERHIENAISKIGA